MKNLKTILFLFVFICCAQNAKSFEQGSLGSRIKLQDASAVSQKANGGDGYSSPGIDPITNSLMGGMSNMMQGMSGNYSNIQSVQENMKMQQDYIKQAAPSKED